MPDENQTPSATFGFFATPFYRTLAGHQAELESLRDFILAREDAAHTHPDSPQTAHSAVYESRFDLFSWPDQPVQNLKNRLYGHLMNYLADTSAFDEKALQQLRFKNESWYHITRSGGYFQPHTHPLASVSMIYCVDPGDAEIKEERAAGQVLFADPRHGSSMYLDPANRHMRRDYAFDGLRFRLRPDDVCIFPSYLQHSVEPYVGESPRITIAANFSFHLK